MKTDTKTIIIVLVVLLVLLSFGGMRSFGGGMMGDYSGGFLFLGWIFNLLMLILVILGILWLIKNVNFNERRRK